MQLFFMVKIMNKVNLVNKTSSKINYPHIEKITSSTVSTDQAAFYLNRNGQTLRNWACYDNGPIKPRRINGRLAWPIDQIKVVLGVAI